MNPAVCEISFQNMDLLPMGIMVLDRQLRVCFWNACLESWTGFPRTDILNRDAGSLFPQLGRSLVVSRLADLFEGAPPAIFSYHLHNHLVPARLPDGSMRLQHSVAYGLRGPDGDITHVVLSLQDVTEIHSRLRENLRVRKDLERENRLRKKVELKLRELATRDMLTGLVNRRSFLGLLTREIRRSKRYGHPLCLMALDLDHFKRLNDTWGHLAGDEMLKTFASACQETLRDIDHIGRLGGEEFGIIMPETPPEGARIVGERLLKAIRNLAIRYDGSVVRMTASIGLASLEPEQELKDFLLRADQAMYQAKLLGRDRLEQAPAATR
ncbi:MAG: diguanylate cyclase [Acidobacteriota bacterium]